MILYAYIRSQAASESRSLKLVFLKRVEEPHFFDKSRPTPLTISVEEFLFIQVANFRSAIFLTLSPFAVIFQRFYSDI